MKRIIAILVIIFLGIAVWNQYSSVADCHGGGWMYMSNLRSFDSCIRGWEVVKIYPL